MIFCIFQILISVLEKFTGEMKICDTKSAVRRVRIALVDIRPPVKSVYWKTVLYFSSKKYVVGTQKNRLNETVLLSTQNTCLN